MRVPSSCVLVAVATIAVPEVWRWWVVVTCFRQQRRQVSSPSTTCPSFSLPLNSPPTPSSSSSRIIVTYTSIAYSFPTAQTPLPLPLCCLCKVRLLLNFPSLSWTGSLALPVSLLRPLSEDTARDTTTTKSSGHFLLTPPFALLLQTSYLSWTLPETCLSPPPTSRSSFVHHAYSHLDTCHG